MPSFTSSNSCINQNVSPDLVAPLPNTAAQPPLHLVTLMPHIAEYTEAQPTPAAFDNAPKRPENDRPATGTGALVSTLKEHGCPHVWFC